VFTEGEMNKEFLRKMRKAMYIMMILWMALSFFGVNGLPDVHSQELKRNGLIGSLGSTGKPSLSIENRNKSGLLVNPTKC
jgi:hypothetical protein